MEVSGEALQAFDSDVEGTSFCSRTEGAIVCTSSANLSCDAEIPCHRMYPKGTMITPGCAVLLDINNTFAHLNMNASVKIGNTKCCSWSPVWSCFSSPIWSKGSFVC